MERLNAEGWKAAGAMSQIPHSWWAPIVAEIGSGWDEKVHGDTRRPLRVLELGCGEGLIARNIVQCGLHWHYIGMDFQKEALDNVVKLFSLNHTTERFEVCHCDVLEPWNLSDIDVVFSSGLLEHFEDDEIVRILHRGWNAGARRQVHLIPNGKCKSYVDWKKSRIAKGDWPYGKERTIETLAPLYKRAGLDCYEYSVANNFVDLDTNEKYLMVSVGWMYMDGT